MPGRVRKAGEPVQDERAGVLMWAVKRGVSGLGRTAQGSGRVQLFSSRQQWDGRARQLVCKTCVPLRTCALLGTRSPTRVEVAEGPRPLHSAACCLHPLNVA